MKIAQASIAFFLTTNVASAFVPNNGRTIAPAQSQRTPSLQSTPTSTTTSDLAEEKKKLFDLLGTKSIQDSVLADPLTKEAIEISAPGVLLGGEKRRSVRYDIKSPSNKFGGSSDTFIDLLKPIDEKPADQDKDTPVTNAIRQALPLVPIPLRGPLGSLVDDEFIPMRDLFTSPAVSFAYERGWRQGFASAGFPGPDTEAEMAMDYFAPVVAKSEPNSVVVDMSCATGLFTRRFAESEKYGRVLGCDYSESMLTEARRRINEDKKLSSSTLKTKLDLVRLDVGEISMMNNSVDCLHAGAAMHCWPDLESAMSEIYRVLKPGGRYFATTFLSTYFSTLQRTDGASQPSQQAFQYFDSIESLRSLVASGGFKRENIMIEVLGNSCVVIRAEKEL